jgi:CBS domain-containing protein
MAVRDLLMKTKRSVVSASAEISIIEAIGIMDKENSEVLIVEKDGRPVGIFSSHDFLILFRNKNREIIDGIKLEEIMTQKLISVSPDEETDTIMNIMLRSDATHLPVIEDDRLIGVVQIHELMLEHIHFLEDEISRMKNYIEDLHEAGWD